MRVPVEPVPAAPLRSVRRYQAAILFAIVGIILVIILLQATANLFTNFLWYRSVGFSAVWRSMVTTKLALGGIFTAIMLTATWVSLWVVDRIAPRALFLAPELELVRRYQQTLGRHRLAVRSVVAVLLGLAVGASATGQWQHWLLYANGGSFGVKDPQFHRDVGFYVFKLPFLSFLVDWTQLALIVLFIVSVLAHYLNGGLRFSGSSPRVDPRTVAHLSTIAAGFALLRAISYFTLDRYGLAVSGHGYVAGAGYTDVHVRLPALELLALVALVTFGLLVFNIYQRSLALPAVAVGLWAFIAIVIGVIFPAVIQVFQVTPSQSTAELPYISRNIAATRAAMNLNVVSPASFSGNSDLTVSAVAAPNNQPTLSDVGYWDPGIASQTYQKIQSLKGYYTIAGLSSDRYMLDSGHGAQLTPVLIGAREVVPDDAGTPTWVNVHLQYTHGYGYVMAPANSWDTDGAPSFQAKDLPPSYGSGAPTLTGKYNDIYFAAGMSEYAIVDTKQSEVDYPNGPTGTVSSHYSGSGGIPLGGFWTRAAFALRFHDFNLLVSHLITPQSRIMFVQDIQSRVQKVAPFLSVDSHPYPVVANGQLFWIVDAYTTSAFFPYAQPADTSNLLYGSGLSGSYNYVRDAVKAVVSAYTGAVTLYAVDESDPILRAWETVFPGMFQPLSSMPSYLQSHLRYPQDLLVVQATMYGRYHLLPSEASAFYARSNVWQIAPQSVGNPAPLQPVYELLRAPGQSQPTPSFYAVEPMVPYSPSGRPQTMSSFLLASSTVADYDDITSYQLPTSATGAPAPSIVYGDIQSDPNVSRTISLLDQHGSQVTLGPMLFIPIDDSMLYIETMYLRSTANPAPEVKNVIVYYNNNVYMTSQLLGPHGALADIFGQAVSTIGGGSGNISSAVRSLLADANSQFHAAQTALAAGDYATWGKDLAKVGADLKLAEQDMAQQGSGSGSSGSAHSSSTSGSGSSGTGSSGTGSTSSSPFSPAASPGSGSGSPASKTATNLGNGA